MTGRKGWVECGGERLALVVTPDRLDFDGSHKAFRVKDKVWIQETCCEGALVDELEKELGQPVDLVGWFDD